MQSFLDSRLVLVTGKGGTGKTTYAAALGRIKAAKGQRTVVCEVDAQRPAMVSVFDSEIEYTPREVLPNLSVCNLTWKEALGSYLERTVPISGLVKRILANEVVNRFLDFTPGSRELVIWSQLGQLCEQYDTVIVDMPASGHAYSLLAVLRQIQQLFKGGPVRERTDQLLALLRHPQTYLAFVCLPEEIVVNETIETFDKFKQHEWTQNPPFLFLNRGTRPTLTEDERALIQALSVQDLAPEAEEFVRAGRWESDLEAATQEATTRLLAHIDATPSVVPSRPNGGRQAQVVEHVAVHLGRDLGLTRRDVSWT